MADANWMSAYEMHLGSPKWARLKAKVWERCGNRCEGCREREPVELHHLTYARVGNELLNDVIAYCRQCHRAAHRWSELDEGTGFFRLSSDSKTYHVDRPVHPSSS